MNRPYNNIEHQDNHIQYYRVDSLSNTSGIQFQTNIKRCTNDNISLVAKKNYFGYWVIKIKKKEGKCNFFDR